MENLFDGMKLGKTLTLPTIIEPLETSRLEFGTQKGQTTTRLLKR